MEGKTDRPTSIDIILTMTGSNIVTLQLVFLPWLERVWTPESFVNSTLHAANTTQYFVHGYQVLKMFFIRTFAWKNSNTLFLLRLHYIIYSITTDIAHSRVGFCRNETFILNPPPVLGSLYMIWAVFWALMIGESGWLAPQKPRNRWAGARIVSYWPGTSCWLYSQPSTNWNQNYFSLLYIFSYI